MYAPSSVARRTQRTRLINEADAMFRRATGRPLTRAEADLDDAIEAELRALGDEPFGTLGEQLAAIAIGDTRLVRAAQGVNQGMAEEGGFLVQTSFANQLLTSAYEDAIIASRCTRPEYRSEYGSIPSLKIPGISETSRADGSRYGGATAYWASEADQVSDSRPKFKYLEFIGKKLIAVCFVSNEMLADAALLDFYVRRAFAAEFSFKLDEAVLKGSAGRPLGILNAPCLITVPKETGQASATLVADNIAKMWSRLPIPSRRRASWFVQEGVESVLALPPGWYQPAGSDGIASSRLMGAPVVAVEQASALGSLGDIVLADLSHYLLFDGGVNPTLSAHFAFVNDQAVFRFVLSCDGMPEFSSPITPYAGSTTRSPFVALAAR